MASCLRQWLELNCQVPAPAHARLMQILEGILLSSMTPFRTLKFLRAHLAAQPVWLHATWKVFPNRPLTPWRKGDLAYWGLFAVPH